MLIRLLIVGVVAVCLLTAADRSRGGEPPMVETPKVLAGEYVDTTSLEGIVEGVFKRPELKTDEQRVMAFYHWYRRMVYPYRYMSGDRRDALKAINTAGFSLCGSQAAVCGVILRAAGYPFRPVQVAAGNSKEWGHTVWEVNYDGRWHLFDAMTAFYVMTRDNPPHVASVAEIEADPTLASKATAEKRCGPEFVYTARNHEITLEQREQFRSETGGQDVPWSLLTTKGGTMEEFWNYAAAKQKIASGSEKDSYGGSSTPGVLDIKLKANERYVRQWSGVGKWLTGSSFVKYCPQNMAAGDNEAFDVVNFKYFEPYRQERPTPFNKAIYRSYGNGWLEWEPKTGEQQRQGVEKLENLKSVADRSAGNVGGAAWEVVDGGKPASLTIPVKSPYGVVEIELELAMRLPPAGEAAASVTLIPYNDGKPGAGRRVWASNAAATTGPDSAKVETKGGVTRIVVANTASPIYEYALKLELTKAAGAEVGIRRVKTTFQLNPMSLPGLTPGANKIRVSAARPGKIAGGKLVVRYDWLEAPGWQTARSDVHELGELPGEYEISLPAGEKLPKMKSVELFLKAE